MVPLFVNSGNGFEYLVNSSLEYLMSYDGMDMDTDSNNTDDNMSDIHDVDNNTNDNVNDNINDNVNDNMDLDYSPEIQQEVETDKFANMDIVKEKKYMEHIIRKYKESDPTQYCEVILGSNLFNEKSSLYHSTEQKIIELCNNEELQSNRGYLSKIITKNKLRGDEISKEFIDETEYVFRYEEETYSVITASVSKYIYCYLDRKYINLKIMFLKGRDKQSIDKFLKFVMKSSDETPYLYNYVAKTMDWVRLGPLEKRDPSTLVLGKGVYDDIVTDLKDFEESKKDYSTYGIPYKKIYMFAGDPGTGKSSLAKILASEFNRSIYILNFDQEMTDDKFINAIHQINGKDGILLLEDIDCMFKSRENTNKSSVSFSTLLNLLDGVYFNSGLLTIVTTNHVDLLDPALIRPFRVDKIINFDNIDNGQIEGIIKIYNLDLNNSVLNSISKFVSNNKISPAGLSAFLFKFRKHDLNNDNILSTLKEYTEKNTIVVDDKNLYI